MSLIFYIVLFLFWSVRHTTESVFAGINLNRSRLFR